MDTAIATWTLDRIQEGQRYAFEVTVSERDVDAFGALSGDKNPLHMDETFARERGFERRVVHGAFLAGLCSRLVGMHLPGRDGLLHELQLKFRAPAHVGDRLAVAGTVVQKSDAGRAIVLRLEINGVADDRIVATGKAVVGFTETRCA